MESSLASAGFRIDKGAFAIGWLNARDEESSSKCMF